jgi:mannose-1-phosphate guanylyltransferase
MIKISPVILCGGSGTRLWPLSRTGFPKQFLCLDKKILLTENQSTYIPLGETHRLSNPGTIPLEIIEVQFGSHLGEDDIVRFEDNYG